MNKQIRVMIVDDHQIVRTGLSVVINAEPDMTVIAEAANGCGAIEKFSRYLPDVTLIDLRMPEMGGSETISAIRRQFSTGKFIVLTTFDHDGNIYRAFEAGAVGYLLKGVLPHELVKAIRQVHNGFRYFPPQIAERLRLRQLQSELTTREHEVLALLAQGRSNKEIAASLEIAESTVRWFLTIIYDKLGVRDRTNAVTTALRRKLVDLEDEISV
ncbi:MAG TPA: response regulator transcription factor [Blastocatellia bacterium]|nr:response regulator transcription factor [Blastocatellia bacterium]